MKLLRSPLISAEHLYKIIDNEELIIFDASIAGIGSEKPSSIATIQLPKARYFDIRNVFSNTQDPFPNAVPSQEHFNHEAQKLGVNNDSFIVAYDDKGIYSSARVWWLFKAFGFNNVVVLDGGLPEWLSKNYPTENKQQRPINKGNFIGHFETKYFKFFNHIKKDIINNDYLILDARSHDRFHGLIKEPREGLRSGHIPNSKNLPYTSLFNGNLLKSKSELQQIFDTLITNQSQIIFSCGSGITACILALAATLIGIENSAVYDGSWTEYGSLTT